MKAQSQSRDRQTACRLNWLCFGDANPHEQEGRQAGLGMGVRIAGVQGTKQSVAFMETANTFQSQSRDRADCLQAGLAVLWRR